MFFSEYIQKLNSLANDFRKKGVNPDTLSILSSSDDEGNTYQRMSRLNFGLVRFHPEEKYYVESVYDDDDFKTLKDEDPEGAQELVQAVILLP